jgi:hypothetical protein
MMEVSVIIDLNRQCNRPVSWIRKLKQGICISLYFQPIGSSILVRFMRKGRSKTAKWNWIMKSKLHATDRIHYPQPYPSPIPRANPALPVPLPSSILNPGHWAFKWWSEKLMTQLMPPKLKDREKRRPSILPMLIIFERAYSDRRN